MRGHRAEQFIQHADGLDHIGSLVEHHAFGAFGHCRIGQFSAGGEAFLGQGLQHLRRPDDGHMGGLADPENLLLQFGHAQVTGLDGQVAARNHDAKRAAGKDVLVEAAIGAHAPFTVGDDTLKGLAEAVRESKRGLHIHVAEDKFDAVHSRHEHGKDICRRLDDAGLLDAKAILGHGLYLTTEEIQLVNERDAFLAHNAQSNMNNDVGYNRQLPLYKNAVLGTDGIGSDMLASACFAFFKHRDAGGSLWMDAFLAMLQNGNRLLERYFPGKRFGRIEAGYEADLAFWDYDPPTPLLDGNVAGHAAFGMNSAMVQSTMVAGIFVIENRKARFDYDGAMAKGREQTLRLWKRMEERK